jgi:hypothetical protein
MPIGDQAAAAGYSLVPDTGSDDARVRWGAREINRTRDFIAAVKALIPVGKAAYRTAAGISSGTANPTGGVDGDIYFKIVT